MRDQYEAGDTKQFCMTVNVVPDAPPHFAMIGSGDVLVSSVTAQQSSDTSYYAMVTMPQSSDGVYLGEWYATKTVAGTPYPFVKRQDFVVIRTPRSD